MGAIKNLEQALFMSTMNAHPLTQVASPSFGWLNKKGNIMIETIGTATRKSKYGRKSMLPELRRSYQFKIGFTQFEYEKLFEMAERAGLPECELIRKFALNQDIKTVSQINRQAYSELAKLASNLNQLARVANTNGIIESTSLIEHTLNAVQNLRQELISCNRA